MATGPAKDLSKSLAHSFEEYNSLGEKNIEASEKCKNNLINNLDLGDTATFTDTLASSIEKVPFVDVPILFYEAQREFKNGHYAQAISKVESVLLREGKGLENDVRIHAMYLKAQCLYKLQSYADSFAILSHIYNNYYNVFPLKKRLEYRFLMGKICIHLKDYRNAHRFLQHIIEIKDSITEESFYQKFDISDYAQVLLLDTDCLLNKIGLANGKEGYQMVQSHLAEAKSLFARHSNIKNKEQLEEQFQELELELEKHIQRQG